MSEIMTKTEDIGSHSGAVGGAGGTAGIAIAAGEDAARARIRELTELLNRARRAYEQEDTELMSNFEYDRLYDELENLEKTVGMVLSDSPTANVG